MPLSHTPTAPSNAGDEKGVVRVVRIDHLRDVHRQVLGFPGLPGVRGSGGGTGRDRGGELHPCCSLSGWHQAVSDAGAAELFAAARDAAHNAAGGD